MSRTIYTSRPGADLPVGSYGPLDEFEDRYTHGMMSRRLEPTREQEIEAGWLMGDNLSNSNAAMILRALGMDPGQVAFDPQDIIERITLARATDTVDDSGFAASQHGNFIDCGIRPGYFADRFASLEKIARRAIEWGADVVIA